jgi:hypothetical protein
MNDRGITLMDVVLYHHHHCYVKLDDKSEDFGRVCFLEDNKVWIGAKKYNWNRIVSFKLFRRSGQC